MTKKLDFREILDLDVQFGQGFDLLMLNLDPQPWLYLPVSCCSKSAVLGSGWEKTKKEQEGQGRPIRIVNGIC